MRSGTHRISSMHSSESISCLYVHSCCSGSRWSAQNVSWHRHLPCTVSARPSFLLHPGAAQRGLGICSAQLILRTALWIFLDCIHRGRLGLSLVGLLSLVRNLARPCCDSGRQAARDVGQATDSMVALLVVYDHVLALKQLATNIGGCHAPPQPGLAPSCSCPSRSLARPRR